MSDNWVVAGGGRLRNAPLRLFLEKWSEDCVPRSFAKMKQQSVLSRLPGTTPDSCFTHLEEEGDWHIAMCSINIWANVCSPSVLSVPSQDIFFWIDFPLSSEESIVKWGMLVKHSHWLLYLLLFVTQGKLSLTVGKQNCPDGNNIHSLGWTVPPQFWPD